MTEEINWKPRTLLGKQVLAKEITDISEVLNKGIRILESEIVEVLIPGLETELVSVGQSKGKFGGGKSSIWRQTQKKTKEGNKPKFATAAVSGNKDGYVGIGFGKSKETVPAREKAIRKSKLSIIKIVRGCGDWACGCAETHSIPFKVSGKCGSSIVELIPAPKGTGLCVEDELKKILKAAGIKDIYSKTYKSKTKLNLFKACFYALGQLEKIKVTEEYAKKSGLVEGMIENGKDSNSES